MSDCENVEVRELLPELMLGTLSPATHERVESHVAGCRECAEELAVLRMARRVISVPVPRIDVAAIVRSLPSPPGARRHRFGRPQTLFRIAAAVSFISLGGISLVVARSFFDGGATPPSADSVRSLTVPPVPSDSAKRELSSPRPPAPAATRDQEELTVGGGVSDLDTDDLRLLLGELERLEAAPVAEPDHEAGGPGFPSVSDRTEGSD